MTAPTDNPLHAIPCHFIERRWMRSQKTWRCFLALPNDSILQSQLTGMINDKVAIHINGAVQIDITPVEILDVPHKGKKFTLIFETCYEQQATIGPYLTALADTDVKLTISAFDAEDFSKGSTGPSPTKPVNSDPLTPEEIRGLHARFFHNERFWAFLAEHRHGPQGRPATSAGECKEQFKEYFRVASCKDIPREEHLALVQRFNEWLSR